MSMLLVLAAAAASCPFTGDHAAALCKDKVLVKEGKALNAAYDQWLENDTRDNAIRGRKLDFEKGMAFAISEWAKKLRDGPTTNDLQNDFVGEREDIEREIKAAQSITPSPEPASLAKSECHASALDGCWVAASGYLNSADGSVKLMWQKMLAGRNQPAGTGMLVVWDMAGERAREIGHVAVEGVIDAPHLIEFDESALLHIPAHGAGTGWGNRDALFEHRADGWHNIEMEGWKAELPNHAAKGLELWKGVDYQFEGMSTEFPLWRENDGNCCGTGGTALVHFVVEDNQLKVDDWSFEPPASAAAKEGKSE